MENPPPTYQDKYIFNSQFYILKFIKITLTVYKNDYIM